MNTVGQLRQLLKMLSERNDNDYVFIRVPEACHHDTEDAVTHYRHFTILGAEFRHVDHVGEGSPPLDKNPLNAQYAVVIELEVSETETSTNEDADTWNAGSPEVESQEVDNEGN